MKFDFSDPNFVIVFTIVIVLFCVLVGIIVTYFLSRAKTIKYQQTLLSQSNSVRIFIIDYKSSTVLFFNRANLKNRRVITLTDFYNQFYIDDRDKIADWVNALVNDDPDTLMYHEADVVMSKNRKTFYSLVEVVNINREKGLIHLESHILRYAIPKNKVKTTRGLISTKSDMAKHFETSQNAKGTTFVIRFFRVKGRGRSQYNMDRVIFSRLKDQIFPFSLSKNYRNVIEIDNNSIAFVDFKMSRQNEALFLGRLIAHSLLKYIYINGLNKDVAFTIGVVQNRTCPNDFEEIIKKGLEAALIAQERKDYVVLYDEYSSINEVNDAYTQEIQQILKDKNLIYCYRPILNVDKLKIIGYFSYAKPSHSVFSSLAEIKEYSSRSDLDKAVFSTVARNIIPKFISAKLDDTRLFFNVSLSEKESIFNVIKHINGIRTIKLVLVFDELDLSKYSDNIKQIVDTFKEIHNANWEIGLSLSGKDLLLATSLYEQFDFFIVGSELNQDVIKYSSKIQLFFRSTVEKLLKFNKPIIATNLYGWTTIELMIKLGINYISSDDLGEAEEMILPIDKKKITKVSSINTY